MIGVVKVFTSRPLYFARDVIRAGARDEFARPKNTTMAEEMRINPQRAKHLVENISYVRQRIQEVNKTSRNVSPRSHRYLTTRNLRGSRPMG